MSYVALTNMYLSSLYPLIKTLCCRCYVISIDTKYSRLRANINITLRRVINHPPESAARLWHGGHLSNNLLVYTHLAVTHIYGDQLVQYLATVYFTDAFVYIRSVVTTVLNLSLIHI